MSKYVLVEILSNVLQIHDICIYMFYQWIGIYSIF